MRDLHPAFETLSARQIVLVPAGQAGGGRGGAGAAHVVAGQTRVGGVEEEAQVALSAFEERLALHALLGAVLAGACVQVQSHVTVVADCGRVLVVDEAV